MSAGLAGWPQDLIDHQRALRDGRYDDDVAWLLVATPTLADPSRAPEGRHTVKLLSAQPWLEGDRWEELKHRQARRQLERVRRVCPAFTDDAIVEMLVKSPVDIEAQNRHMIRGTFHGGDRTLAAERPAAPGAGLGAVPHADPRPLPDRRHDASRAARSPARPAATPRRSCCKTLDSTSRRWWAVPDARVQAAIDNWAPRFTTNGVDPNDFRTTTARIERWDEWLDAWSQTGGSAPRARRGGARRGRERSAGEAFVRAAVCFHFAKFVWVVDAERNRATTQRAIAALYAAHALLDPTAERVEAPLDGGRVAGNLRRPRDVDKPPLVILIPGLDSTKEEFFHWEDVFLARGMATLSLDGPGQGETGFSLDIRPDYEAAVGAILDAVSARGQGDVDLERVGARGCQPGRPLRAARGGVREAAARRRGGQRAVRLRRQLGRPAVADARDDPAPHRRVVARRGARARARRFRLPASPSSIDQPCLVITGRHDRLIPWEDTKRIADEAPGVEWVLFDDGNHVCNNIPYKYRPLVGDWMRAQLS